MLEWAENSYGERYLPAYNDAFSRIPSKAVFKQYLHESLAHPHALYIVIGSDSGLLPKYVSEHFKSTGSKFIFIELPEVAEALQADYPALEMPDLSTDEGFESMVSQTSRDVPLVTVMSDLDLSVIPYLGGYNEYLLRDQIKLVKSLSVVEKEKSDYQALFTTYENALLDLQMNHQVGAVRHFMNASLKDAPDLIYPLMRLKDFYQGKTFVLLGGAPSLPLIFPWLKAHRDEVIVMAAIRIAGRLAEEGITPDYFVGVDPQPQMLDYSRQLFQFHDKSVLITSNHLAPSVQGQWAGRNLYMQNRFPFADVPDDEEGNVVGSGPTVMNSALMVAGFFGAERIILSGVDMCFDPQGYSHESSSLESQIGRYLRYGGKRVMTYAGIEAETDTAMLSASQALLAQVNWLKLIRPTIEVINVNQYATAVEQIDLVPVDALPVIADQMTPTLRQQAWELASISLVDYKAMLKHKVIDVLQAYKKRLEKTKQHAQKALKTLARVKDEQDARFSSQLTEVIKARKAAEKAMGDDLFTLFDFGHFDYVKLIEPFNDDEPTVTELLATLTAYFSALESSAKGMTTFLQEVIVSAEWRLRECDCQLTQALVDYWIEQGLPGRCHVWFERCGHPVLDAEQQALFDRAAQAFTQLLSDKVPSFKGKMLDKNNQLISLWSHVKAAVKGKDIERMQDLADYVATIEGEEFQQLSQYLYANVASVNEEWEKCDQLLSQITHERLLIPALQLKLENALKRKDAALLLESLEDLAAYDKYYLLMLATLANLLGYQEIAGNAFIYYLMARPDDLAALWDYWRWLQEFGDIQAIEDLEVFIENNKIDDALLLKEVRAKLEK
ncbi:MAG: DUF115 domain-containing protein [Proteobacteria bacterium]|nr:DUF115 domain-containing protein [Pseudomonadota bacterium]